MRVDSIGASEKRYLFLGGICSVFSVWVYWWASEVYVAFALAMLFWLIFFFIPLLVEFLPRLLRAPGGGDLKNWHGIHYLFDQVRVRVTYSGGLVWLATEDIFAALELPLDKDYMHRLLAEERHRPIPGTQVIGISEEHLRDFVLGTNAEDAQRFVLWFERQVLRPIKNKVNRGFHIPESVDNH